MSPAKAPRVSRTWIATLLAINALGVVLVVSALSGASASPGTVVTVGSGSTTVGGTVAIPVTIVVDPADDEFNAIDLTLSFDTGLLNVTNVTMGSVWSPQVGSPTINEGAGTVRVIALTGIPSGAPDCGSGCTLFTVTFQGQGNGLSPLTISGELAGAGFPVTPGAINNGSLQVGSNDTPTSVSDTPTSVSDTPTSVSDTPTSVSDTPTSVSDTPTSVSGTATSTSDTGTATETSTGTTTPTGTRTETVTGTVTATASGTPSPDGSATGTETPDGTETPTGSETPTGTPTATGTPGPEPGLFEVYVANAARDGTD